MNILSWSSTTNNGAFQKEILLGIWSDLITEKPQLTFSFTDLEYDESIDRYLVDNRPMTEEQKREVALEIKATHPNVQWLIANGKDQLDAKLVRKQYFLAGKKYPQWEIDTWAFQAKEAEKVLSGGSSTALEAMTVSRDQGESVQGLAKKIQDNNLLHLEKFLPLLGKYQKAVKTLNTAKDERQVIDAINAFN